MADMEAQNQLGNSAYKARYTLLCVCINTLDSQGGNFVEALKHYSTAIEMATHHDSSCASLTKYLSNRSALYLQIKVVFIRLLLKNVDMNSCVQEYDNAITDATRALSHHPASSGEGAWDPIPAAARDPSCAKALIRRGCAGSTS